MTVRPKAPDFIIVGTPRSGTTLVQRLASELVGVRVPPETHFFVHFYPDLIKRNTFPLRSPDLEEELDNFAALPTSQGMQLDVAAVLEVLGKECSSPADLFSAVVRGLAGSAQVVGEKTPDHLKWWRPLTGAFPSLKVIWVVRDPRAVVASNLGVPWGMDHPVLLAERWRLDQQELAHAARKLGQRLLTVRYEDVIHDTDATQTTIATFIGSLQDKAPIEAGILFGQHEHWKASVLDPISESRVRAWEKELSDDQVEQITALCRRGMEAHAYVDPAPKTKTLLGMRAILSPETFLRGVKLRIARRRQQLWISKQDLTAGGVNSN